MIYQKFFTGELKKNIITFGVGLINSNLSYQFLPILKWREVAKKHLPKNAVVETAEFEFKCEYLHLDFNIPSRTIVPNTQIPEFSRRSTNLQKQVGTVEFKNKFNSTTGHAFNIRLIQHYDSNFEINQDNLINLGLSQFTSSGEIFLDGYTNDIDNQIDIELDYPISELLFNIGNRQRK